ncbi:hypothetical protein [Aquabacterium sp.]|uniref:hypothetical protein n=1 Tax=Aquabacterium sp. TaxID=1872578 RepID=UPI0025BE5ECE|nr:hypothetical protein [Aquabacterium sp.]
MGEDGEFRLAACVFEHMKQLQSDVQDAGHWPEGVAEFDFNQLGGVGFFPGAKGAYVGKGEQVKDIPVGGVMVLGHDWGTVKDYTDCLERDAENVGGNRTWDGMRKFFNNLKIDLSEIYFTNFFMGLREGAVSVGEFPGGGHPAAKNKTTYVDACRELVRMQIVTQKPKVLIVYGAHLPRLISPLLENSGAIGWKQFQGFKDMDKKGTPLVAEVGFEFGRETHITTVVSLVHPCYRNRTAEHRSWKNDQGELLHGDVAEKEMVLEAMRIADRRLALRSPTMAS